MSTIIEQIRDILMPRGCAGCDCPDVVLCDDCADQFQSTIVFPLPDAILSGFACATYTRQARHAILSWKDHDDVECDSPFAQAMISLIERSGVMCKLQQLGECVITPMPSSPASIRKRGRRQCVPLARAITRYLCAAHIHASYGELLCTKHVRTKSVQQSNARARQQRIKNHLQLTRAGQRMDHTVPVILIDDIVTTGSTMRSACQVLQQHGYTVMSALTLAYTPRRDEP